MKVSVGLLSFVDSEGPFASRRKRWRGSLPRAPGSDGFTGRQAVLSKDFIIPGGFYRAWAEPGETKLHFFVFSPGKGRAGHSGARSAAAANGNSASLSRVLAGVRLTPEPPGGYSKNCSASLPRTGPHRLARPRTSPFHGGNAGSNPAGDAISRSKLPSVLPAGLLVRSRPGNADPH
jgi:hypothetical protein